MDITKIKLFINTLKYLKPKQVYYRFYYFFNNSFFNPVNIIKPSPTFNLINWNSKLKSSFSYEKHNKTFSFLNIKHKFFNKIDWEFSSYGKLWTYNLNYFDFLNQKEMTIDLGLELIHNYIKNDKILKIGKEPYPTSLRGINWIKFIAKNKISDPKINVILYSHYRLLNKNLEYHLLGNHLLENAFSLLFGAYYFQDEKLYTKAKKLLISELEEQILKDGAHFELSTMYHQIIFSRLLDCIQLIKLNPDWKKNDLLYFLEEKASLMNSWLQNVTYSNGEVPMVNDSTYKISPTSKQLFSYSKYLNIPIKKIDLSDSGYRKIVLNKYELFVDIGNVGPDYQPGHAHSDTFNFELINNGKPIFVDTGISTYEKNNIRQNERSTYSHNTVQIDNIEQTQVWSGFRVANRAKVINRKEIDNRIEATHNGYEKNQVLHTRIFICNKNNILIQDKINKPTNNKSKALFHLHHTIKKPIVKENKIMINEPELLMILNDCNKIEVEKYQLSEGFNKTKSAYKIIVTFDDKLLTTISL